MDRNERLFYVSGALSLTIFFTFTTLFAYILFKNIDSKTFALKKDNFISVDLAEITPQIKEKKIKSAPVEKPQVAEPTPEPVVETQKSIPDAKDVDVNDLFSDVWTQKIVKPKEAPKKDNSKRLQKLSKKIKKSEIHKESDLTKKIETLNSKKQNTTEQKSGSSADEVNEYLAKIQSIVYDNFYPPVNSQGNLVKVVIELDSIGQMIDFRVLTHSANEALNNEVDKIKRRLQSQIFPKNPDHQTFRAIINLIPENKE